MNLPVDYTKLHWKDKRLVREEYVKVQKGLCYHCGGYLKETPDSITREYKIKWRLFPDNFLKYPVHLHHCHNTGLTVGAVHAYCNAVLWQYFGE